MMQRIRKSMDNKEQGFTLIELLVVIIIIGILSAIAIPLFLNQRKKAEDSAAKADVSTIGKEIATWLVDAPSGQTATVSVTGTAPAARWTLTLANPAGAAPIDLGAVSNNVVLASTGSITAPATGDWCVAVQNLSGDKAVVGYKYSKLGGLKEGVCP